MNNDRRVKPFVQVYSELVQEDALFLEGVQQFEAFNAVMTSDSIIRDFLVSPAERRSNREGALRRTLEQLKFQDVVVRVLVMMIRKNVISCMSAFTLLLKDHADERCGIARGKVSTAVEMEDALKSNILALLSKWTSKKAEMEFQVDEALLGGVKVRMKGLELDASLQKKLLDAKLKLKKKRA